MSQATEKYTMTDREKMLHEMERDLAWCHAAVVRSIVVRNLYRMMFDMIWVVAIAAGVEILSSAARLLLGGSHAIFATSHGLVGITVLILGACFVIVRAVRRILQERPPVREVAERLDLAVEDHNRIATAWWLMKSQRSGPMVEAAIDDGLAHLKLFKSSMPDRSGMRPTLAAYRSRSLIAGALLVLAVLFQPGASYFPSETHQPSKKIAANNPGKLASEAIQSLNPTSQPRPAPPKPDQLAPPSDQNAVTASEISEKLQGTDKETEGTTGAGKSSAAQSSTNASSANSSASDSSTETKGKLKENPGKKPKTKKKAHKNTKAQKPKDSKGGSSSVSHGSSGGGSMLAVQHDWEQRTQAAGSETDEDLEEDEEIDNEEEENSNRGGVQPTLKDRNESPSRELGLDTGGDLPGSGRGGPSAPKKSRGTASLVLGVPMPDFVRGRLSPGPTKVTQERVRPVPMQSEAGAAAAAKRREMPEPVIHRTTIPAEMQPLVREYLIQLHQRLE